jgi:YidC/Oxa1 family membrane protein insertase
MSVLDPLSHALAALLAAAHTVVTSLGLDPAAGTTWALCIAVLVAAVRIALLPLAFRTVRHVHAAARARPQLDELTRRYRNRRDPGSLEEFRSERRRIAAEHDLSRLSLLPLLVQLPIWLALYHLVADAAAGLPVGAVDVGLAASLGAATLLGVPLAERGYLSGGCVQLAVVAGLAVTAATLSYVTQRFLVAPNTVVADVPEVMARVQQLMPTISAVGLLAAGGAVPVALLVYWTCNGVWTLGQSAVVWRWFPTPGSPAAARAARR